VDTSSAPVLINARITHALRKEKEQMQIKEESAAVPVADPALVSALRAKHALISTEQQRVRTVREVLKVRVHACGGVHVCACVRVCVRVCVCVCFRHRLVTA
jgi:hypothetical protein